MLPVEFLPGEQPTVASPAGSPTRSWREYFFLDNVGQRLIEPKRRDHNKLQFATVLLRWLSGNRFS